MRKLKKKQKKRIQEKKYMPPIRVYLKFNLSQYKKHIDYGCIFLIYHFSPNIDLYMLRLNNLSFYHVSVMSSYIRVCILFCLP